MWVTGCCVCMRLMSGTRDERRHVCNQTFTGNVHSKKIGQKDFFTLLLCLHGRLICLEVWPMYERRGKMENALIGSPLVTPRPDSPDLLKMHHAGHLKGISVQSNFSSIV